MRILLVMDPFIKVPPAHYGGIERVVADLADQLVRLGHEVTLWAAPGSHVNGTVDLSASIACDHGQVESLCGKSFAHMSRRQFIRLAVLKATQSSWNVV